MVENTSATEQVVVDDLVLNDPTGVHLVSGSLIPWNEEDEMWIMNGMVVPPEAAEEPDQSDIKMWKNRLHIGTPEAVVNPGDSVQVGVELTVTGDEHGFIRGFTLTYHTPDGTSHTTSTHALIAVGTEKDPCHGLDLSLVDTRTGPPPPPE